jgi:hypothetical protein
VLDDLTRAFETKVTELVGGLSTASATMETTAQSMSSTASATNRQAGVVAAASEQTSTNVQTVASATEELTSSISEIARQVTQSTEIAARAVDNARRSGDTARCWPRAPEDRRRRDADPEHRSPDHLLALNATIEAAMLATDVGLPWWLPRSNRWPADRQGHHRNFRTDRGDPGMSDETVRRSRTWSM